MRYTFVEEHVEPQLEGAVHDSLRDSAAVHVICVVAGVSFVGALGEIKQSLNFLVDARFAPLNPTAVTVSVSSSVVLMEDMSTDFV